MPNVLDDPTLDPELLLVKRQRAELVAKKINAIRAFGLRYYKPQAKQDAFHRAGARVKMRMLRAGNRYGKSTCGCAEDCSWLLNERPWVPEGDPFRRLGLPQHPVKGLIITTDWDKVDEIWTSEAGDRTGKFWQMMPSDAVKRKRKNSQGVISEIELRNKSLVKFETEVSYKQNPRCVESSDWDFIHVDEPCPEKMYKGAARGLVDRGGSSWFTLTPLDQFWINDMFFPQDTGGKARSDVWTETATMYENIYLRREDIEAFASLLTEDEKECRLYGIPLHLSGLVYKEFSWDRHVLKDLPLGWNSFSEPPVDWTYYGAIDPHPQTPHAVLLCAVSPFGVRYYFNDIFQRSGMADLATSIFGVLGERRLRWCKMDPLGFIEDPEEETSMATEITDAGLYVEKATKALQQGIIKCRSELKQDPAIIRFSPMCRRTLWEIQRYCWDDKDNRPKDENDHMMENFYRLEISGMKYIDKTKTLSRPIADLEIPSPDFDIETLNFGD